MKKLILFLLFSIAAWADSSTGNITASGTTCGTTNACIVLHSYSTIGSASITVTGTWSATLQFETSADGSTWAAATGYSVPTGSAAQSITANGVYQFNMASLTYIRVRGSAYTSGTAAILISGSSSDFATAIANSIITATVATLPDASGSTGWVRIVTDALTTADCTVGGGSAYSLCVSNGSAWVNPGGGGSTSAGGSNGQLQYNNSNAFGGITNATSDGTNVLSMTISGTLTSATINNSGTITAGVLTSSTVHPATAGAVRLANGDAIDWRNAANSANIPLSVDSNNTLVIGSGSGNVQSTSFSLLNAAAPGLTANTFTLIPPTTITTAYCWSVPAGENASAGLLHLAAASAHCSAGTVSAVVESDISLSDNTTGNASTTAHGFVLKGDNNTAHFLRGDQTWATPPGTTYDCTLITVFCAVEEMPGGNTTSGAIGSLGWNNSAISSAAALSYIVSTFSNPGELQFTTNTSAGNGSYFNLAGSGSGFSLVGNIGGSTNWTETWIFKVTSDGTKERIRIGFGGTSSVVEPTDGIWVRYDKNATYADTTWHLCIRQASTNSCQATTKTFDANWHKVVIRSTSSGVIGITWDSDAELTWCTAGSGCTINSATFPSVSLTPVADICNDGTTADVTVIDYFSLFITGLTRIP